MDTSQFFRRKGRLVSKRRGAVDLVSPSYDWRERQRRQMRKALGWRGKFFASGDFQTPTRVDETAARILARYDDQIRMAESRRRQESTDARVGEPVA